MPDQELIVVSKEGAWDALFRALDNCASCTCINCPDREKCQPCKTCEIRPKEMEA